MPLRLPRPVLALHLVLWLCPGCTESNPEYASPTQPDDAALAPTQDSRGGPHADVDPLSPDAAAPCPPCTTPPSACYAASGTCSGPGNTCTYAPLPAKTPCEVADPCLIDAACDGQGHCLSTPKACNAPHAKEGVCVGGSCAGFSCEPGWGNCNGTWDDGCERDLRSDLDHCGTCGTSCPLPANAARTCEDKVCGFTCTAPFEDCNQDVTDGCEIPVGVPNSCDRNGLSSFTTTPKGPVGCGTPYCGKTKTTYYREDFGTWHCVFCAHCQAFDKGYAWCMAAQGTFATNTCPNCCDLSEINFPQVCAD